MTPGRLRETVGACDALADMAVSRRGLPPSINDCPMTWKRERLFPKKDGGVVLAVSLLVSSSTLPSPCPHGLRSPDGARSVAAATPVSLATLRCMAGDIR